MGGEIYMRDKETTRLIQQARQVWSNLEDADFTTTQTAQDVVAVVSRKVGLPPKEVETKLGLGTTSSSDAG